MAQSLGAPEARSVDRAWELFVGYQFADLSLADCVSFAVMRGRRIKRVFTFDRHFGEAGFERWE